MADMDEEFDSLFEDSSLTDDDMDDFLKMMDGDDSSDIFSDDDDDGSSFLAADGDADGDIDSFGILDDWEEPGQPVSDNKVNVTSENKAEDGLEDSFTDIDNLFTEVSSEDVEVPNMQPKKSLLQKIKAIFKPEITDEQRQEREAEAAEEAAYEERINSEKEEKKKVKAEAKAAAKEEAEKKKQEKSEAKKAQSAAKKAEAAKKKQEKAAKKAEKNGGPIPKSQIVPVAPLIVFVILGAAASVVIILGSDTKFYSSSIKEAKELFIHQKYDKAYESVLGLEIKEKDKQLYEQVTVVNLVDNKLQNYYSYIEIGRYEEALDSLLSGVRKHGEYIEDAKGLGLITEFEAIYQEIADQLVNKFGIGLEEANSMLELTHSEYSNKVKSYAREAAIKDGVLEKAVEPVDETSDN